jgi:hypothetical protein
MAPGASEALRLQADAGEIKGKDEIGTYQSRFFAYNCAKF